MTDEAVTPKAYVVGFVVDLDRRDVVLIRKNRPEWQAGRLNGVGGKIEPGETPEVAMAREFGEEAGLLIPPDEWDRMCSIRWREDNRTSGEAAVVHFFRHVYHGPKPTWLVVEWHRTDEELEILWVDGVGVPDLIPNLTWLLPLAFYTADRYEPFDVWATVAESIEPVGRGS